MLFADPKPECKIEDPSKIGRVWLISFRVGLGAGDVSSPAVLERGDWKIPFPHDETRGALASDVLGLASTTYLTQFLWQGGNPAELPASGSCVVVVSIRVSFSCCSS